MADMQSRKIEVTLVVDSVPLFTHQLTVTPEEQELLNQGKSGRTDAPPFMSQAIPGIPTRGPEVADAINDQALSLLSPSERACTYFVERYKHDRPNAHQFPTQGVVKVPEVQLLPNIETLLRTAFHEGWRACHSNMLETMYQT